MLITFKTANQTLHSQMKFHSVWEVGVAYRCHLTEIYTVKRTR